MKSIAVVAVLFTLVVPACGSGQDVPVNCTNALNHFYDRGCNLYVNGAPADLQEAIGYCEEVDRVSEPGVGNCQERLDTLLRCLNGVGSLEECQDCAAELDSAWACS